MQLAQKLDDIQSGAGLGEIPETGFVISSAFKYVFWISGFLLLIYMMTGGFQLMFAKGDPKAVSAGWAKVTNALIGFIIILIAYTLTSILGRVFGITIFGEIFK